MTAVAFRDQVLAYSHLPSVFLQELAKVADRIPEAKRAEIIEELDSSAERELNILAEGYKIIAEAEKKVRKEVETVEHATDMAQADAVLTQN